jgi:uncharacterized protein (TIRG00374 family)
LSCIYAGIITPGGLGEFIKVLYLKSVKGISITKGVSSGFIDRLLAKYFLIILAIIGTWHLGILGIFSDVSLILITVVIFTPFILLNKKWIKKPVSLIYNLAIMKK